MNYQDILNEYKNGGKTKSKTSKRYEDILNEYKYAKVNEDYINTFIDEANSFFDSTTSEYEGLGWGTASGAYDKANSSWSSLAAKENLIRGWLDYNKANISDESYNSLLSSLDSIKTGGTFYGGEKFWCPDMTANYDSNNYRIFRYADAVLMMAESLCRLGYAQKAVEYLDQVRARAGLEGYSYLSEAEMIKEIQNERARELGGEMHRKFDLVRWGIWYDQTLQFNEQDRVKSNIRECHQYYPIPDTECALSGGILKNEAYL